MTNETTPWIQRISSDSARTIAKNTGLSHTTISRTADNPTPPPAVVVAVARAYGYNPVTALAETGLLTHDEAQAFDGRQALNMVSSRALLQELLRREATNHSG